MRESCINFRLIILKNKYVIIKTFDTILINEKLICSKF